MGPHIKEDSWLMIPEDLAKAHLGAGRPLMAPLYWASLIS